MTQRAFTLEAGAAIQAQIFNDRLAAHGRGMVGVRRAVDSYHGDIQGGGHMHQARIIADYGAAQGHQVYGIAQFGFAAEIQALVLAELINLGGVGNIFF